MEGLFREDAEVIKLDGIRHERIWNGNGVVLDKLSGHQVRLKVYIGNKDLVSFRPSVEH